MIIVTGASGKLGGAAVRALLETVPAERVGVLARSAEKVADLAAAGVRVHVGDYEDPASLKAAFAGADGLLFVSGSDVTPGYASASTATWSGPRPRPASGTSSTPAPSGPTGPTRPASSPTTP